MRQLQPGDILIVASPNTVVKVGDCPNVLVVHNNWCPDNRILVGSYEDAVKAYGKALDHMGEEYGSFVKVVVHD